MIVRMWRGTTRPGAETAYVSHLREDVLPQLASLPGFRGARVMREPADDRFDFVVMTYWDDLRAVSAFAGPDPSVAVVPPEAEALLATFDSHVHHLTVVLDATSSTHPGSRRA